MEKTNFPTAFQQGGTGRGKPVSEGFFCFFLNDEGWNEVG